MAKVTGGDRASAILDAIAAHIEQAGILHVGFLESETYPDGTPVAQVAYWNEFGTEHIPPRPFFRHLIETNKSGWSLAFGNLMKSNNYDVNRVFALMGEGMKDQLTRAIIDFSDPNNAPATVDKKGFDNPLIDTGVMQKATGYEIK